MVVQVMRDGRILINGELMAVTNNPEAVARGIARGRFKGLVLTRTGPSF